MLRTFSFLTFVRVLLGIAAPLWCAAQTTAPSANYRSARLDMEHVALDLVFDFSKKQARGTATLTMVLLQPTRDISLDAGMLTIHSITGPKGTPLTFEYDGGDKNEGLLIHLDKVYPAQKRFKIQVNYSTNWVNTTDPANLWGSYGKGIRFFEPTNTEPRKRRQIWSMGEPESNRYWFPACDSPNDFHTTEFTATVAAGLTAISNGRLIDTHNNADGTRTFHWKMETPCANHQTAFVIGEYVDIKQQYNGVELHQYSYPDETDAVKASVERLTDMVRFYSEKTGKTYPYPSYSQVFVQEFPWGGGHHSGFSTISENMVDDYGTHSDFFYLWDGVEANDLAAQWFGSLLTPRSWEHAWLNKSFARYFDGLYSEYKNGRAEYLIWNQLYDHSTYLWDWNSGVRRPIVSPIPDPETLTRDNYASLRGASVLNMLRKQIGEEHWWKAIRAYVKDNAGKSVTTQDFQKAVEAATGTPMSWFFDQWVYKMGHPVFEVTQQYDSTAQQLTLILLQTQTLDSQAVYPQAAFFQGKMDIELDGRIETVQIEAKTENRFSFYAPQRPQLINIDYESTWIKEIKFEKSVPELLYQMEHDRDVLGQRLAMTQLVTLAKNGKMSETEQERLRAAFSRIIQGQAAYWRLRYIALGQLQNLLDPGTRPLDKATTELLLQVIRTEKSWNRAAAVTFLGMTRDTQHTQLYLSLLQDSSDRVVNAAANALGKSKAPEAFDALMRLPAKPSWKNQSLISALNGLKELGDPRGGQLALTALQDADAAARWTLATPVWDFRIAAAETLAALGRGAEGCPVVRERWQAAMEKNELNDIFSNVLLITTLACPQGQEIFDRLKVTFKDDPATMSVIAQYETQFQESLKNK